MRINGDLLGNLTAFFFIIANAYYPAKIIMRKFLPGSKEVTIFFRKYLKVHILFNLLGMLFLILHGHYADERNYILQMATLMAVAMTVEGALMHYRYMPGALARVRLLHCQQSLFVLWFVLIVLGHALL